MAYYIYSGAGGSGTGADWTNAFTSFKAMMDSGGAGTGPGTSLNVLEAGTEDIYVASDHVEADALYGASTTLFGPVSGTPVKIISADRTSGEPPATFTAGTGYQIRNTGGTYNWIFDGAFAVYGLRIYCGGSIQCNNDADEICRFDQCYFIPGSNGSFYPVNATYGRTFVVNCTFDGTSGGNTVSPIYCNGASTRCTINGMQFVSVTARTGAAILGNTTELDISNCDFSGFTHATLCEPLSASTLAVRMSNCKLTTAQAAAPVTGSSGAAQFLVNCSATDAPENLNYYEQFGRVSTDANTFRSGGATIEEISSFSWLMASGTGATEQSPLTTPWAYGVLSSTGSKTFSVAITSDTQVTESQCWLEVETMETANSPIMTRRSDWRGGTGSSNADILDGGATAQTADGTSSWTAGKTYSQTLSVAGVSVGETGQFRWRVCVGYPSITVYLDPKVTVS